MTHLTTTYNFTSSPMVRPSYVIQPSAALSDVAFKLEQFGDVKEKQTQMYQSDQPCHVPPPPSHY